MCNPTFFGCPYDDAPRLALAFDDIRRKGHSQARIFAVQAQNLFSASWQDRLVSLSDALANQGTPEQDAVFALSHFERRVAEFLYTDAFPVTIQKLFLFHSNGLERLAQKQPIKIANLCYTDAFNTKKAIQETRPSAADLIEDSFRPLYDIADRRTLRIVADKSTLRAPALAYAS